MTQFEKWFKDNGYDPKGNFKLTSDGYSHIVSFGSSLPNSAEFKLFNDDGDNKVQMSYVGCGSVPKYWFRLHYLIQEKQLTQFDLTEFEKWCKDRGYDPKGNFKLTSDGKSYIKRINRENICMIDKCLKVLHDDGTRKINFIFVDTSVRYWLPLNYLIQEKKDSMIDFDYKKVLPVCWVRDRDDSEWHKRWYVGARAVIGYTVMSESMVTTTWAQVTFEDPNDSLREDLRNKIRDYECKIAELKEVLEKMQ